MHRQRLIEYAQGRDHMDFGFVGYVQCHEEACQRMAVSSCLPLRSDVYWQCLFSVLLCAATIEVEVSSLYQNAGNMPTQSPHAHFSSALHILSWNDHESGSDLC